MTTFRPVGGEPIRRPFLTEIKAGSRWIDTRVSLPPALRSTMAGTCRLGLMARKRRRMLSPLLVSIGISWWPNCLFEHQGYFLPDWVLME